MRELAAWALGNILRQHSSAVQTLLAQHGVFASLVGMLGGGGSGPGSSNQEHSNGRGNTAESSSAVNDMKHAAFVLGQLAETGDKACSTAVAAGAVPPLVKLLASEDEGTMDCTVLALHALSSCAASRPALLEAGVVPPLQQARQRSTNKGVQAAAERLEQLLTAATSSAVEAAAAAGAATDQTAAAAAPPATAPAAPLAPPTRPPAPRICAAPGCGAARGLKCCGGCGTVRYCSYACCKVHWHAHKGECRRLQAERVAAAAATAAQ